MKYGQLTDIITGCLFVHVLPVYINVYIYLKLVRQVLFCLNNNTLCCQDVRRLSPLPRLFFVPFLFAVTSSSSIFFSRKSCFLVNISSVSRSRWIASWGVGCFPPLPPLPNSFTNSDILVSTPRTIKKSPAICSAEKLPRSAFPSG